MAGTARAVPVHRLRPNETEWTPPSVIFVDTETRWHLDGTAERHRMRLWVGCHVDRREVRKTQGPVCWGWGETPGELADWLTARTAGRDCVWVYAHNLNFDLAVSDLPATMAARGWAVTDFAVQGGAPWLRLKRGKHVLTVVDSWTWLPQSLDSVATLMGRHKVDLPANTAGMGDWWQRCAVDVDLTARAVLALMGWWDAEQLGRWSISGAGSGYNAMRHTPTEFRHVIDVTPDLVAQDREAVRGGRKDAAVVRSETGGPWVELDLVAAYPTVARDVPLPVRRAWTFDQLDIDAGWHDRPDYGVIAECVVDTDRPRYPARAGGVTWFPVGRFVTTLAGPELAWARANGDLVEIRGGQVHRLGLALRPWATWVLDPTRGGTTEIPEVAKVACKVWGRSVLGKFAARSHTATALEGVAPDGWEIRESWDDVAGRRATEVRMGGRAWYVTYDQDTENCYPAVLAWVESEVRVRLGKVLEALAGAWWTADTDGMLVDMAVVAAWASVGALKLNRHPPGPIGAATALCDALAGYVAPLTLRPKRYFDSLTVLGPQHLIAGGERRLSGVRSEAVETAPMKFVARDWPKLKWQMANSAAGTYTRPERTSTFAAPTVHRWVVDGGQALPVEMRIAADGGNELVPWAETRWARDGAVLAGPQYRKLARVG